MNDSVRDPTTDSESGSRWLGRIGILAAVLIAAIPCAYIGGFVYQHNQHGRVSDRMETAILRLSLTCPGDLTEDQWAYCIARTWNLHCNYGLLPDYIPTADLQRIVDELEAKTDVGPSLATIDWLWDEYVRSYPRALSYENWRPTSPANRSEFEAGAHGGNPLSQFRSDYERRIAEK